MCKELILILPYAMIYSPVIAFKQLFGYTELENMSKLKAFGILLISPLLVVIGIILYIIFSIYLLLTSKCSHSSIQHY